MPPDAGVRWPPVAPSAGTSAPSPAPMSEPVMVCFSCGRPGHGVNRCAWVDTYFLFLLPGWSASWTIGSSGTTDPGGGEHAALATRNRPV